MYIRVKEIMESLLPEEKWSDINRGVGSRLNKFLQDVALLFFILS